MRKPVLAETTYSEIHGDVIAMECFVTALCQALSPGSRKVLRKEHQRTTEVARTLLLNSGIPDGVIDAFERSVQRQADAMSRVQGPEARKQQHIDQTAASPPDAK